MLRPKIFQVVPTREYEVYVYFDDGKIKLYDAKPLLARGGIFNVLKDINFFMERCTIMNGTLAWDLSGNRDRGNCIDICPDTIYDLGVDVKESVTA